MVEVDEITLSLMAQKRDCALAGQDAPAEDIAKRLFVSEKMVGDERLELPASSV